MVAVRLVDAASGSVLAEDFHFPLGLELPRLAGARVTVAAQWDDGPVVVTLSSDTFLQSVAIDCDGFAPSDNHFHVTPGRDRHLVFTATDRARSAFTAHFEALNAHGAITARARRNPGDRTDETR